MRRLMLVFLAGCAAERGDLPLALHPTIVGLTADVDSVLDRLEALEATERPGGVIGYVEARDKRCLAGSVRMWLRAYGPVPPAVDSCAFATDGGVTCSPAVVRQHHPDAPWSVDAPCVDARTVVVYR